MDFNLRVILVFFTYKDETSGAFKGIIDALSVKLFQFLDCDHTLKD